MLGNFACCFVVCRFFALFYFKKIENTIRVSNSQAVQNIFNLVTSDLGPNFFAKVISRSQEERVRRYSTLVDKAFLEKLTVPNTYNYDYEEYNIC